MNITPIDAILSFISEAIAEVGGHLLIAAGLSFVAAAFGLFLPRRHPTRKLAWLWLLSSSASLLATFVSVTIAYFLAPALLVLAPFVAALVAYGVARHLAS